MSDQSATSQPGPMNCRQAADPFTILQNEIRRLFDEAFNCRAAMARGGADPYACRAATGQPGNAEPYNCRNAVGTAAAPDAYACRNALGQPAAGPADCQNCRNGATGGWPRLALRESDAAYTVIAELPGLAESDVEVTLAGDALCIRGEKRTETHDARQCIDELFYGQFERRLPVPPDVARGAISGSFRNGVLTVTLPRDPAAAPPSQRIPLSA